MKTLKALTIVSLLLLAVNNSKSQNLIGYHIKDIGRYMKENQKNMILQGLTFNNTFRYLKYTDRAQKQTLFYFLTPDSVCRSVRLVCDKEMKESKINELNSRYKKVGDNLWEEDRDGKKYLIDMKEEDWTFNISINIKPINQ